MYDFRPNLIIGFHGCDDEVKQKLINSSSSIQISQKPYDWLGHGMYFWENNHDCDGIGGKLLSLKAV